MTEWTADELSTIGDADEIRITSLRRDGSLRTPKRIWVVRLGDDLYVRSVNGHDSAWHRGTQVRREGRIQTASVEAAVTFADADLGIDDQLDAAYRTKYGRYPERIVNSIVTPKARSATLKLLPR